MPASNNRLLASLQADEWTHWKPRFERVRLALRTELTHPDDPIDFLWFPEGGVQSQIVESATGGSVEVAIVGREGVVGLPAIFGMRHSATRTITQSETTALRIGVQEFLQNLHGEHPLLRRLERYAAVTLSSLAQIAGCNRLHRAEQRLCRWLLMVRNRVDADRVQMTHEFLALMLGTSRASVTELAQSLQTRKLIRYERGIIEFTDAGGLEEQACECYGIIEALYRRSGLLPESANTSF